MSATTTPPPDEVDLAVDTGRLESASRLRIYAVLALIVLMTEVVPVQYTMITPALHDMSATFPDVGANINWIVILIGLVGASATPLLGKMSDIWGKKLLFVACGVLFVVGSLIDAVTDNWTLFLIGRGLQAFAVASQFIAFGLIRDLMPRRFVATALGFVGAGIGIAAAIAPVIGGVLLDHFSWRSLFWSLGGFTALMTLLVVVVVPESKLRVRDRIDPFGAVLLSVGTLLVLLYLDNGQSWGWGRATSIAWLVGGLVLLALFFVVETRVSRPMVDLRLLLNPKVSMVLLMSFFGVGIIAIQPLTLAYMTQTPNADGLRDQVAQGVVAKAHEMTGATLPVDMVKVVLDPSYSYGNGFSMLQYALHVGLWAGLVAVIAGPLGGWLAHRYGARIPAIAGFAVNAVAGVGYILVDYSWATYSLFYALSGIGFGFFYAAVANLVVDAVPQEQQGISTGMLGVTINLGTAVSLAVVTALLNNNPIKASIDVMGNHAVQPIPQVFADSGYTQTFWLALGTAVIALVLAVILRHGRAAARGGADHTD
ncbi:MFS transporter [Nocardia sp. NPDC052112]|uniref:MFS transporter n=1 Tax=Nocardia sp. NPDC052112 TaxID=3155646 RepID=UPI0034486654